jgi:outer membrane protein OmpA-like peptidoglycan-associated protein
MILSSRRAKAVAQYFRSRGVSQAQLHAVGVGEAVPIASNKTHAGRMKNRRVELLTLPDLDAQRLSAELLTLPDLEMEQLSVELPTIEAVVVKRLVASNRFVGHPRENNRTINNDLSGAEVKLEPTLQSKEIVSSASKANQEPAMLAAKIIELPVPGHHSGTEISGIVDGVVFESGSFELSDTSSAALEPLKKVLLEEPTIAIAVMAHSDDAGSDLDNEKLTMLQANSIIEFLTKGGVNSQRMQAEGYGGQLPLVQNVTDEDRARNRRIEIRILPSWPKQ